MGIFSQRAKHRRNPIGVTTVPLIKVNGHSLFVRGLDAIDGAPALDYQAAHARVRCADWSAYPEWLDRLMLGDF